MIFRSLAIVAAFAIGVPAAGAQSFPETMIAIEAKLAGASAEEIARRLAPAVENRVGAVEGLQFMLSLSRIGRVEVRLKFKPGVSEAAAAAAVRAQLARLAGELPRGAAQPSLAAIAPEAQPIAYLAFWSDRHSALEITRAVEPLATALSTIEGISMVYAHGSRWPIIRIALDRPRLAAYGVTRNDIVAALRDNRVEGGSELGKRVEESDVIIWMGIDRLNIQTLEEITVKAVSSGPIRLRDVARVTLDAYDSGTVARFNGKRVVLVEVQKQRGTPMAPATLAVYGRAQDMATGLPAGLRLLPGYSCEICAKAAEKQ